MLHVKIERISEIPFTQIESNCVMATIYLHPVGFMKKLSCPLEQYDSYINEIVSFPLDTVDGFSFRIVLLAYTHDLGNFDVAELEINLRSLKLNRWSRGTFRMTSLGIWDSPLITVTAEVSDSMREPFTGHRSHFDMNNIIVEKDREVNIEEAMAKTWFRLIPEQDWPLVLRPDFSSNLIAAVEATQAEITREPELALKHKPRKRTMQKMGKSDTNPLPPPKPINGIHTHTFAGVTEAFMITRGPPAVNLVQQF